MWDERVNAAIDEVAQQMTGAASAAGADLRRRVLARVASGDAPRASWRVAVVLSPIAVAAAIAIAVFVARTGPVGPGVTPQQTPSAKAPEKRSTGREGPVAQDRLPPIPVRPQPSPLHRFVATGNAATTARAAWQLDALAEQPLDVAALTVDALTPDPIQIERLETIAPIDVAPLDTTDVQRRYE
jgi:hypothetical protein